MTFPRTNDTKNEQKLLGKLETVQVTLGCGHIFESWAWWDIHRIFLRMITGLHLVFGHFVSWGGGAGWRTDFSLCCFPFLLPPPGTLFCDPVCFWSQVQPGVNFWLSFTFLALRGVGYSLWCMFWFSIFLFWLLPCSWLMFSFSFLSFKFSQTCSVLLLFWYYYLKVILCLNWYAIWEYMLYRVVYIIWRH